VPQNQENRLLCFCFWFFRKTKTKIEEKCCAKNQLFANFFMFGFVFFFRNKNKNKSRVHKLKSFTKRLEQTHSAIVYIYSKYTYIKKYKLAPTKWKTY
jgi:hypothetical protein